MLDPKDVGDGMTVFAGSPGTKGCSDTEKGIREGIGLCLPPTPSTPPLLQDWLRSRKSPWFDPSRTGTGLRVCRRNRATGLSRSRLVNEPVAAAAEAARAAADEVSDDVGATDAAAAPAAEAGGGGGGGGGGDDDGERVDDENEDAANVCEDSESEGGGAETVATEDVGDAERDGANENICLPPESLVRCMGESSSQSKPDIGTKALEVSMRSGDEKAGLTDELDRPK